MAPTPASDGVAGLRWWVVNHLPDGSPEQRGLLAALEVVGKARWAGAMWFAVSDGKQFDAEWWVAFKAAFEGQLDALEVFEEEAGE